MLSLSRYRRCAAIWEQKVAYMLVWVLTSDLSVVNMTESSSSWLIPAHTARHSVITQFSVELYNATIKKSVFFVQGWCGSTELQEGLTELRIIRCYQH